MSRQEKKLVKQVERVATAVETANSPAPTRDTSRPDAKKLMPWRARVLIWIKCKPKHEAAATAMRRSYPIMAYVGPNGGGKSAAMIKDSLPSLWRGRRVLSTVRLLDYRTGQDHPNYERFTHVDQLLEAEDCDILMDEMVGIAGAREALKLDVRVQNILVQLRRRNVVLRWSAPNWARADKIVREVTQAVTECRGYYEDRRAAVQHESGLQLWAPKRLFHFRTFDTIEFEDWTAGKRDRVEPIGAEWWFGVGSKVFNSYDTMDAVERVAGMTTESNTCAGCGGYVQRKRCSCGTRPASRALEVAVNDEAPDESPGAPLTISKPALTKKVIPSW